MSRPTLHQAPLASVRSPALARAARSVVLLRPVVVDPGPQCEGPPDPRELELAWGCQVVIDDILRDHGFRVIVDRREVVRCWPHANVVDFALTEAAAVAPAGSLALLTRFDARVGADARAEGVVVDLRTRQVITRGRAAPSAGRLMAWLTHVPDHCAFALGEPTPKVNWRELLGVRDAERALAQVRLAGALARLARLGPAHPPRTTAHESTYEPGHEPGHGPTPLPAPPTEAVA